jgi:hypothetical protein
VAARTGTEHQASWRTGPRQVGGSDQQEAGADGAETLTESLPKKPVAGVASSQGQPNRQTSVMPAGVSPRPIRVSRKTVRWHVIFGTNEPYLMGLQYNHLRLRYLALIPVAPTVSFWASAIPLHATRAHCSMEGKLTCGGYLPLCCSGAVPRKLFRVAAVIATVARTPYSRRAGHSNGREKSLVITLAASATVVSACRRAPGNAGFDRSVSVCPPSCPGISPVPSTATTPAPPAGTPRCNSWVPRMPVAQALWPSISRAIFMLKSRSRPKLSGDRGRVRFACAIHGL